MWVWTRAYVGQGLGVGWGVGLALEQAARRLAKIATNRSPYSPLYMLLFSTTTPMMSAFSMRTFVKATFPASR